MADTPYHKRRKLTEPADIKRHIIDPAMRLSDLAGYTIDLYCKRCNRHAATTATALMRNAGGGAFLSMVLKNARCRDCGLKSEPDIRLRAGPIASPFDQKNTAG